MKIRKDVSRIQARARALRSLRYFLVLFFSRVFFFVLLWGRALPSPQFAIFKKRKRSTGKRKDFHTMPPKRKRAAAAAKEENKDAPSLSSSPPPPPAAKKSRKTSKKSNDDEEDEKKNEEDKLQSPTNEKNKGEEEVARDDDDDDDEKRRQQQQQQQQQQPQAKEEKVMKSCPYLSFVNRPLLDFDFEKRCSGLVRERKLLLLLNLRAFFRRERPKDAGVYARVGTRKPLRVHALGKWQSVLSSG